MVVLFIVEVKCGTTHNTDKFHQVRVPLNINGENCTDRRGCKELYNNDTVNVPGYNSVFRVQIYELDYQDTFHM